MRRFLIKSVFFLLPFGMAILCVTQFEVPRWYAYRFTGNEGCNIEWIYHRIYRNPNPIDVAFIGSSHTGCGIDDNQVQELCALSGENGFANLAYCGAGRNIQYLVVKDLLKQHKPDRVFIEVRAEEDYHSHRDFGVLAESGDAWSAPVWGNQRYGTDLWKAFQVRYFYMQAWLYDRLEEPSPQLAKWDHSFHAVLNDTVSREALDRFNRNEQERLADLYADTGTDYRAFKLDLSRRYIRMMAELCAERGTKLVILYIPAFGKRAPKPLEYSFYRDVAEVWIPPDSLFTDPNHWIDDQHFNTAGARRFSTWLSGEINRQFPLRSE